MMYQLKERKNFIRDNNKKKEYLLMVKKKNVGKELKTKNFIDK